MIVHNPCQWVYSRVVTGTPFFAVRFNDGEMAMMFRTRPEGEELGTKENKAHTNYENGDALRQMLADLATADPARTLVGCSWWHDGEHPDTQLFRAEADRLGMLDRVNWCHEHWPLECTRDGTIRDLIDVIRVFGRLRDRRVFFITCDKLMPAGLCLGALGIAVPTHDAWDAREEVYGWCREACETPTKAIFVWAAGCGLKPTAWRLYKEFPGSSHLDVGHLFNGAMGLNDYGWLERKDGPWYEAYMRDFAPYVRSFIQ